MQVPQALTQLLTRVDAARVCRIAKRHEELIDAPARPGPAYTTYASDCARFRDVSFSRAASDAPSDVTTQD